ncbi:MAG: hypothetical protein JXA90_13910 [Planctomycetes bacterium]|nr:hypothetical protein [Planctomycetota bacterium]
MRGLVAVYYVVLRAILRNQPNLRRYVARCRHCWIFFIADPRNAGREDLGCPFGCAAAHRRRRSTERSVRYNGSPVGKAKRYRRERERRRAGCEPSEPGDRPCTEVSAGPSGPGSYCNAERVDLSPGGAAPSAVAGRSEPGPVEFAPSIVAYIRVVVSLIEGRKVSRAEIVEMLDRTRRQHSLAREKRSDYVLRWLKEHCDKPP